MDAGLVNVGNIIIVKRGQRSVALKKYLNYVIVGIVQNDRRNKGNNKYKD